MSKRRELSEADFLKDIAAHQLTIVRDDGLYRHLRFRRPGTYCMGFDIHTWPGYLCYTGDMGTYVFQRIEDMLEFFRDDRWRDGNDSLYINPHYWSEKVQAAERHGGITEFCEEIFRERVLERVNDHVKSMAEEYEAEEDIEKDPRVIELREEIESQVLIREFDGEHEARRAAYLYKHKATGFNFQDFGECDLTVYSHRFLWCCYALVWGIRQYDALKDGGTLNEPTAVSA